MFVIRPARPSDLDPLHRLATSLSAHGFLTLPSGKKEMEVLIGLSVKSFAEGQGDRDKGRYLFVLEDSEMGVVGSSLVIARHGTPESPHLYFQVDEQKGTLQLRWETEGRTELGGLILDPAYRGYSEKLGKRLSYIRLLYIGQHPDRFRPGLLAELLPPFTKEGKSPLWEALGRRFTGLDYREADERARRDKRFVAEKFPKGEISIGSLPEDARASLGKVGPETVPVAKILEEAGFKYLHQVDPFDGGPHYGARLNEIQFGKIEAFLNNTEKVKIVMASE